MGHTLFVPTTSPYYGLILNGIGFDEEATVAGLGLSADGTVLVAANIYNDSISVIDTPTNTVHYAAANNLTLSPNGQTLYVTRLPGIRIRSASDHSRPCADGAPRAHRSVRSIRFLAI